MAMIDTHYSRTRRRFFKGRAACRRLILASMTMVSAIVVAPGARAEPSKSNLAALKALYRRPPSVPFPRDNPFSAAKADLGQKLFFDPRLSGPATMSCASCHNPALSWGDGLPTAVGSAANHLGRRSPTILNLAWAEALFWDGRAATLEEQAVGPMMAPGEMNQTMPKLIAILGELPGYREGFSAAFPGHPISADTIAKAIATFERTVVSGEAPFDRWIAGDETAIGESAKRGFVTFNEQGHCAACHSGWRLTDDSFHDIGVPDDDLGRGKLVSGVEPLRHAFKTPGLRNIAARAPFMHNGSIPTLAAVIRHYDGGFTKRPSLSAEIYKLNLIDRDVDDLVAFLKTLGGADANVIVPVLPSAELTQ